jgi:predicted RNA-binding Zn-ribbon protein involved in translation (DUF1610 family)
LSEKSIEPICPDCGNYMTLIDTSKILIKGTECWECENCGKVIDYGKI